MTGFVAPPRFSRRDTSRLMWFLNGRFLRDKVLHRIVKEGYRGFLVENRQPVAFLRLSMDPALVDVNVHPTKAEVRFREQRRMFGLLVNALREAVAKTDIATPGASMVDAMLKREKGPGGAELQPGQSWLPTSGSERVPGATGDGGGASSGEGSGETSTWSGPGYGAGPVSPRPLGASPTDYGSSAPDASSPSADPQLEADEWASTDELRGPYLQVDKTYLLREVPGGFEVIDQHALHERLTYELLLRDLRAGAVEVQGMLVPELKQ